MGKGQYPTTTANLGITPKMFLTPKWLSFLKGPPIWSCAQRVSLLWRLSTFILGSSIILPSSSIRGSSVWVTTSLPTFFSNMRHERHHGALPCQKCLMHKPHHPLFLALYKGHRTWVEACSYAVVGELSSCAVVMAQRPYLQSQSDILNSIGQHVVSSYLLPRTGCSLGCWRCFAFLAKCQLVGGFNILDDPILSDGDL